MDGQLARDYGRLRGLIRRENSNTVGSRFCFVNGDLADGWIQDTSLLRHWVDPGSEVLAEVDRAQASRLAADLGVPGLDLDGEPVAVDRDGDGVLSSATESPQDDAADAMVSAAREHIRSIHETARFIEEAEQEINRLLGES